MAELTSWLGRPITEGSPIQIWMVVAAGSALLLLVILSQVLLKKRRRLAAEALSITENPESNPVLEVANFQGTGAREDQQDAFAISPMEDYAENGLLMVLCDGMGGMAEGGAIANETAAELLSIFPFGDPADISDWVRQHSRAVYGKYRGQGGTTLVAAFIRAGQLYFWCVGDSDLFLMREGTLYTLHLSQDHRNELVLRSLSGALPLEEAFMDEQAGALSQYIGKEAVKCSFSRIPFQLQSGDTLLLGSDGISSTLSLAAIQKSLAFSSEKSAEVLEEAVRSAGNPWQDNYTAIILKYNG